MASFEHRSNVAAGLWKVLDPTVTGNELARVAKEWMEDPRNTTGGKELKALVRRISGGKDQEGNARPELWGIQFVYQFQLIRTPEVPDAADQFYKKWFQRTRDQMVRKFGEEHVRWDIDSSVIEITAD